MRALVIGLLLLAGCDRIAADDVPVLPAKPAAISFDGADYQGQAARNAHGKRIADVLGCTGCHGKDLQGQVWVDSPAEGLLHASNLTRALPNYTDQQLQRLLRSGEHPTGRDVWGMPSELFRHLADTDMAALIGYLRTIEPAGEPSPEPVLGPVAKQAIAKGELKSSADWVRDTTNVTPVDLGPRHALARYIARATCAECHGSRLEGVDTNPDLIVVGAYSRDEFEKLMVQGVPNGPRKLNLMAAVAKGRFSQMTKAERDALYAYLKARAEQPQ